MSLYILLELRYENAMQRQVKTQNLTWKTVFTELIFFLLTIFKFDSKGVFTL